VVDEPWRAAALIAAAAVTTRTVPAISRRSTRAML
jgi:hypothetical protein